MSAQQRLNVCRPVLSTESSPHHYWPSQRIGSARHHFDDSGTMGMHCFLDQADVSPMCPTRVSDLPFPPASVNTTVREGRASGD